MAWHATLENPHQATTKGRANDESVFFSFSLLPFFPSFPSFPSSLRPFAHLEDDEIKSALPELNLRGTEPCPSAALPFHTEDNQPWPASADGKSLPTAASRQALMSNKPMVPTVSFSLTTSPTTPQG